MEQNKEINVLTQLALLDAALDNNEMQEIAIENYSALSSIIIDSMHTGGLSNNECLMLNCLLKASNLSVVGIERLEARDGPMIRTIIATEGLGEIAKTVLSFIIKHIGKIIAFVVFLFGARLFTKWVFADHDIEVAIKSSSVARDFKTNGKEEPEEIAKEFTAVISEKARSSEEASKLLDAYMLDGLSDEDYNKGMADLEKKKDNKKDTDEEKKSSLYQERKDDQFIDKLEKKINAIPSVKALSEWLSERVVLEYHYRTIIIGKPSQDIAALIAGYIESARLINAIVENMSSYEVIIGKLARLSTADEKEILALAAEAETLIMKDEYAAMGVGYFAIHEAIKKVAPSIKPLLNMTTSTFGEKLEIAPILKGKFFHEKAGHFIPVGGNIEEDGMPFGIPKGVSASLYFNTSNTGTEKADLAELFNAESSKRVILEIQNTLSKTDLSKKVKSLEPPKLDSVLSNNAEKLASLTTPNGPEKLIYPADKPEISFNTLVNNMISTTCGVKYNYVALVTLGRLMDDFWKGITINKSVVTDYVKYQALKSKAGIDLAKFCSDITPD